MENKKNPRIPTWKVWILVITAVQALSSIQDYRIHSQMWNSIQKLNSALNQSIQLTAEYQQNLKNVLDYVLQNLPRDQ